MIIETIRLNNFKSFKNVEMSNIPNFRMVVGAKGSGKATLFDAFAFIKDCLTYNVSKTFQ